MPSSVVTAEIGLHKSPQRTSRLALEPIPPRLLVRRGTSQYLVETIPPVCKAKCTYMVARRVDQPNLGLVAYSMRAEARFFRHALPQQNIL